MMARMRAQPSHKTFQSSVRIGTEDKKGKKFMTPRTNATTTIQRVQRGTNRPSGKRERTRKRESVLRKLEQDQTTRANEGPTRCASIGRSVSALPVLTATSMRATSRANQSSDFRQKITPATATQTRTVTPLMLTAT